MKSKFQKNKNFRGMNSKKKNNKIICKIQNVEKDSSTKPKVTQKFLSNSSKKSNGNKKNVHVELMVSDKAEKSNASKMTKRKVDVAKLNKYIQSLQNAEQIDVKQEPIKKTVKSKEKWLQHIKSPIKEEEEEVPICSAKKKDHFKSFKVPKSIKELGTFIENERNSVAFRLLNEQLYTTESSQAFEHFKTHPEDFQIYHEGFANQASQWPIKPIDIISTWLRKKSQKWIVADFGCGNAELSKKIPQKCNSIDFVAVAPGVIECNMAHTPLETASIDVVVFCLSLMGTDLQNFLAEANRVLKPNGYLKIAEVESRIKKPEEFIKALQGCGFKCSNHRNEKYFWIFDFCKTRNVKASQCPRIPLDPCVVKKR